MPDAYDRLKRLQTLRTSVGARFLSPAPTTISSPEAGPTAPELPSGTPVDTTTQTFLISEEGSYERWSGTTATGGHVSTPPPAPYPPVGEIYGGVYPAFGIVSSFAVDKTYQQSIPPGNATYMIEVALMGFDTSALPDSAVVTSATLRINAAGSNYSPYGYKRNFTLEWYEYTSTTADWTATAGTSAHTGVPIASFASGLGGWIDIPLQNANANVSRTSLTKLRAHVSGGDPKPVEADVKQGFDVLMHGSGTYGNYIYGGKANAPRLVLTYG